VLFLATITAAVIGVNDSGANIAAVTVIVMFFLGMQLVSVVFGDVYWWFNPLDSLAGFFFREETLDEDDVIAAEWTAAVFLAVFYWFVFAYPEFYPPSPREVATFLVVYTLAVLVGAWWWGKAWVRRGEGFGALFGTVAQLFRRRDPGIGPGLAPLLIAYMGGIVFDALSQTNWWINVLGTSRGWTERAINTVGFVWSIGLVALAYLATTRVVAVMTRSRPADTARIFAPMLIPIGLSWTIAHYLSAFLIDMQEFYALLSDPLGRGWNIFGTINFSVYQQLLTPTQSGLLQSLVLAGGCVSACVLAHDAAFANYRGRTAVRATYPLAVFVIGSTVTAIWLLLGV
jgi:hypothetical protein